MIRAMASLVGATALAVSLSGSSEAQAPAKGSWELGGFGRYTGITSDPLNLTPGWGAGGRVGYFIADRWALEGELMMSRLFRWSTGENIDALPWRIRAAYHVPAGDFNRFLLGAGYTGENWSPQIASERSSNQFGAVLGWQMMSSPFAIRLQGAWDRFAATESYAKAEKGNLMSLEFGLTWPGGGPRDSDRDGVLNKVDACPETVMGDAVDARGCALPKDADRDGVVDPNDRCANTPSGTPVDASGCPRDTDRDGIIDNVDRCANTPAGTPVDANGCPRDSDGDGVSDNMDRCANTASGTAVDANGCPRDSDSDGVLDATDRCANTPAGTAVDANGCPLPPPDADNDGVADRDDRCANTPAGTRVDARGCQLLFDTSAGRTALVLQGVTFTTGSATLAPTSYPVLDRVAESLVANAEVRVEVQGHTDNSGAIATNRRLSQSRANSVRNYLISKGVAADRLTAVGYGPDQPKAANTTAAGRAENRRVELKQLP